MKFKKISSSFIGVIFLLIIFLSSMSCSSIKNEETNSSPNIANEINSSKATIPDNNSSQSNNNQPTNQEDNKKSPDMTLKEQNLYNEFIKNRDSKLLKDADPVTIYKIFVTALLADDYETLYALYYKDGESEAPSTYNEYLNMMNEDPEFNGVLKEDCEYINYYWKTMKLSFSDRIYATIIVTDDNDYDTGFSLRIDSENIWRVQWFTIYE